MPITVAYQCSHRFSVRTREDRYTGMVSVANLCPDCRPRPKVWTVDQDGHYEDTGRMEGELNGWEYQRL